MIIGWLFCCYIINILGPLYQISAAVTMSPCPGGVKEVHETLSTTFTCSGLKAAKIITWSSSEELGYCPAPTSPPVSCTTAGPALTRPSGDRGTVTFTDLSTNTILAGQVNNHTLTCTQGTQVGQNDTCQMDLVYPSEGVTCAVQFLSPSNSAWSVSGRCDVTKAYSYSQRYTCQWFQTDVSVTTKLESLIKMDTQSAGGKYKRTSCQLLSTNFPSINGQYTYTVLISPGLKNHTANFTGSGVISRPTTVPTHNCPQYVGESGGVSCMCNSSDLGKPPGVLKWNVSSGSQLFLTNVSRSQTGQKFACDVIWNNQSVMSKIYTLQVAYGPSSISLTTRSLLVDVNGSQNVTLTCAATGVNPSPTFTWPTLPSNHVTVEGSKVTFTPHPPDDDNKQFRCQARNTVTKTTLMSNITTIALNYPPSTDPTITILSSPPSSQGDLYQGDNVTLTCNTTGGKPRSATKVTLTCPGNNGIEPTGVNSVTFNPLNNNNHGNCTCTTRWKETDWYNREIQQPLFVNTPPSPPSITSPSVHYPLLAGSVGEVTLTCQSSSPGRPAATYTWTQTQGGQPGSGGTLTFDTTLVNPWHEGKEVKCRAENRYTENRGNVTAEGTLMLQVYYKPEVTLTPITNLSPPNQCDLLTSNSSICMVTEGQRVHLRCSATSNPPISTVQWREGKVNDTDLYLQSVNRSQHAAMLNCSATTSNGDLGSDARLPLHGWNTLTLLVAYSPAVQQFTASVNATVTSESNITVTSGDDVMLTCTAEGRPSPRVALLHPNSSQLGVKEQGLPSLTDHTGELSVSVPVTCRDTGLYACDVSNGVGASQAQPFTVFVKCAPERRLAVDSIPSVNFKTQPVTLTFDLWAYPTPRLTHVSYFESEPSATTTGQEVRPGLVTLRCLPSNMTSSYVTCNVTVDKAQSGDAGFYRAVVENIEGSLALTFQVQVNATVGELEASEFPVIAVVSGVCAAIVVILVVALVLFIMRRRASKSKKEPSMRNGKRGRREEPDDCQMITNSLYGTSPPGPPNDDGEMIINTFYESSETAAAGLGPRAPPQRSDYEEVDVKNAKPFISSKPRAPKPAESDAEMDKDGQRPPQIVDSGDVYAKVVKPSPPSDVYATVNKLKKEEAPSPSDLKAQKPDVKPKPKKQAKDEKAKDEKIKTDKAKAEKAKAEKTKAKGKKKAGKGDKESLNVQPGDSGTEYSNMAPLSMSPAADASVYENFGFQGEETGHEPEDTDSAPPDGHPDGLTYTTIAFTKQQMDRSKNIPPPRETTEYAGIDIAKLVKK